ncbi:MAG TPA: globin domain-containing protein [Bryobacteraceae bacterium]|nr:globin domain-containing protein [Bryobacteraceae bacterium]
MTPRQKRLIRETFPALHEVAEPLVQLFYGRLFQIAPEVRSMFRNDMGTQTRKFGDMLEALVEGLDDFDQKRQALRAMGLRHVAYGVVPKHYDTLTAAFLWALGHMLYPEFSPEVKEAWTALIAEVSDTMKAGAAELPPGGNG